MLSYQANLYVWALDLPSIYEIPIDKHLVSLMQI